MKLTDSSHDYLTDRKWSDNYIPEIRRIVGPYLLVPSPLDVDMQQAADLIVLKARDMTIAARVRRPGYADRYPFEFTVRSKRDNGQKTELAKLLEGWGDWMFYAHASTDAAFGRWFLIDLHAWRQRLLRTGYKDGWAYLAERKSNGDGTHFVAFDLRRFNPSILIASSHSFKEPDAGSIESWLAAYGDESGRAKQNCA